MITRMFQGDEPGVRELYAICHPGEAEQPTDWYFVYPTLVVILDSKVVGFTSFTVTTMPGFGQTMYGQDICVHPDYRGKGLAEALHTERLNICRRLDIQTFLGVTGRENKGMVKVLEKAGAHSCINIGNDIMFVGTVGGT